jgi:hypothetical protein
MIIEENDIRYSPIWWQEQQKQGERRLREQYASGLEFLENERLKKKVAFLERELERQIERRMKEKEEESKRCNWDYPVTTLTGVKEVKWYNTPSITGDPIPSPYETIC